MNIEILQTILPLGIIAYLIYRNYGHNSQPSRPKSVIIDSCGLIDGRILDLTATLFMDAILVIPEFVLDELQLLADGRDAHKRDRARFGLEVASALQKQPQTIVRIDKSTHGSQPTDSRLIILAQKLNASLYTTDYALNKRASTEGVAVLNVNEIAQQLRPVALPGEIKKVKILKKGDVREQGVGYLEDGTLIIVEGASKLIGKTVGVSITRTLQSEAGKMMFARLVSAPVRSSR